MFDFWLIQKYSDCNPKVTNYKKSMWFVLINRLHFKVIWPSPVYTRVLQPQKCPVSNGSYLLAHVTCFAVKEEIDSSRGGRLQTCLSQKCPRRRHLSTSLNYGDTWCHVRRMRAWKDGLINLVPKWDCLPRTCVE